MAGDETNVHSKAHFESAYFQGPIWLGFVPPQGIPNNGFQGVGDQDTPLLLALIILSLTVWLSGKRDVCINIQQEPLPTLADSCDILGPSRGLTPGRLLSNHQVCLCGLGLLFIFPFFVHAGGR